MEGYYRSKSYADGRMEMEIYYGENGNINHNNCNNSNGNNNTNTNGCEEKPTNHSAANNVGFQELRCYSASYATSAAGATQQNNYPRELKKGKSVNSSSSKAAGVWCFSDPEMQRKKRVASYKSYSVEGKIKRSFSKSFRWVKHRYSHMLQGW